MEKVNVICRPGQTVPREDIREPWLNDTKNDPVPLTPYYIRLIADGSLVVKDEQETKKVSKKAEVA